LHFSLQEASLETFGYTTLTEKIKIRLYVS